MKLWIEDDFVASLLDNSFQERNFVSEVILAFKNTKSTTVMPYFTAISNPKLILFHGFLKSTLFKVGFVLFCSTALLFKPCLHRPRSCSTLFIPLGLPISSGEIGLPVSQSLSPSINVILCSMPSPHFVQCMTGCFPPSRRFILFATRASTALHVCPLELSNANRAMSLGKAFRKWRWRFLFGLPSFRHSTNHRHFSHCRIW
jgi:hypothetical protein